MSSRTPEEDRNNLFNDAFLVPIGITEDLILVLNCMDVDTSGGTRISNINGAGMLFNWNT